MTLNLKINWWVFLGYIKNSTYVKFKRNNGNENKVCDKLIEKKRLSKKFFRRWKQLNIKFCELRKEKTIKTNCDD
jgi:hypothetical protein